MTAPIFFTQWGLVTNNYLGIQALARTLILNFKTFSLRGLSQLQGLEKRNFVFKDFQGSVGHHAPECTKLLIKFQKFSEGILQIPSTGGSAPDLGEGNGREKEG